MKRIWWVLVFFILIIVVAFYGLFPARTMIVESLKSPVNDGAVLRLLEQNKDWSTLPDTSKADWQVKLRDIEVTNYFFEFIQKKDTQFALLKVIPLSQDTSVLVWETQLPGVSLSPVAIIKNRRRARALQQTMRSFLNALEKQALDTRKVYGFEPSMGRVIDTAFLSTTLALDSLPDKAVIYKLVNKLEQYAKSQQVFTNREPILNVQEQPGNTQMKYLLMIAIPIDRVIPSKGDLMIKRMITGNLLVADVEGTLPEIFKQFPVFDAYKEDYGYVSPAIPYLKIRKDHRLLPENEPWEMQFCYPVF
jgi:hypothetical protein